MQLILGGRANGYGFFSDMSGTVNRGESQGEVTLILGGARSGKSRLGETIVAGAAGPAIYVATAEARDDEMRERIAIHRARRGPGWRTEEVPLDLPGLLDNLFAAAVPVLVDCLTLWLTNIMLAEQAVESEISALATCLSRARAPLVLVANETGLGVVPDNALARRFRDLSGRMNQDMAAAADNVLFVAAGLPLVMKGRNPAETFVSN